MVISDEASASAERTGRYTSGTDEQCATDSAQRVETGSSKRRSAGETHPRKEANEETDLTGLRIFSSSGRALPSSLFPKTAAAHLPWSH
jgi:hypothetical protein